VYTVEDVTSPKLIQILPAAQGPEGITTIPERNLLLVATETDERENLMRATISIYELIDSDTPTYPTLMSGPINTTSGDGPYIPFGALSGLASDDSPTVEGGDENILYAVEDSFYKKNRMFVIDTSTYPAMLTDAIKIVDSGPLRTVLGQLTDDLAVDVTTIINDDDSSVNLDFEGICKSTDGGFWIVSEGSGNNVGMNDTENPYEYPNLLLKVTEKGFIADAVLLPEAVNKLQLRFGFEGVAEDGDYVVIAMQRAWNDEPHPRLAIYNKVDKEFTFVYYPLDEVTSQYGGWVGLSDISPLGNGDFLVLERDNQAGPDASIKKLYKISLDDFTIGVPADVDIEVERQGLAADIPVIEKVLVVDLIPVVVDMTNALPMEKFEGLAVTKAGRVWVVNDNDGVDDNSGEILLADVGVFDGLVSDAAGGGAGDGGTSTENPSTGDDAEDPSSGTVVKIGLLGFVTMMMSTGLLS
jgi:hypothetical protein